MTGLRDFFLRPRSNALLRAVDIKPELNPRAVADYVTFGFLLGDKTLDAKVRLLPAGFHSHLRLGERKLRAGAVLARDHALPAVGG